MLRVTTGTLFVGIPEAFFDREQAGPYSPVS